jgi:hypothetical protein
MTKAAPTQGGAQGGTPAGGGTPAAGGGCPPGGVAGPCCNRSGERECTGSFNRMFQMYGRYPTFFQLSSPPAINLPGGVTWEAFYYGSSYAYHLAYATVTATPTGINGTISVLLRATGKVFATTKALTDAAPELYREVTPARITAAFAGWNQAVQDHWTNRRYTVTVGAPECPGTYVMNFSLVEEASMWRRHVSFDVIDMTHPDENPRWRAIRANQNDPLFETAQKLAIEWRSNTGKFNLGDSRGTLVFAHEFGHYMGWGDEYIEVANPPPSPTTDGENKLGRLPAVPLRVAIRIKNPTRVFQSANGTSQEDIDITTADARSGLMSSMVGTIKHPPRFVYTIVDDFITLYNRNHYGGGTQAYCDNVV